MTLEGFYTQIGGNYQEVFSRLCTEDRILKFVQKYPADPTFHQLEDAVSRSDWSAAFSAAHTLKGVALNLDFGDLYRSASNLTEALRGGAALSDTALWDAVVRSQQTLMAAISQLSA